MPEVSTNEWSIYWGSLRGHKNTGAGARIAWIRTVGCMCGQMVSTSGLRTEQTELCALVVIGVNERGQKHFLAIEDGVCESTQSWREVLLKLKSRGMNIPELAIGDGAMGFRAALEEVYPETRQQRCWMHKSMNVLNCLPKSDQPKAKQALHNIWQAEVQAGAEKKPLTFSSEPINRNTRRSPSAYTKTVRN